MKTNHTAMLAFSPLVGGDEPKTIVAKPGFRPAPVPSKSTPALASKPSAAIVEAKPVDSAAEAMRAEIAALRAENARLAAQRKQVGSLTFKVSEKGGLSVYGLGRFPVTLYREQWTKLAEAVPSILAFIEANAHTLKAKGE